MSERHTAQYHRMKAFVAVAVICCMVLEAVKSATQLQSGSVQQCHGSSL